VRVIAGTLGGRKLAAPRGLGTRPTSDRVREALFMSLEPLAELRVVDLFAGSGALGIEALSRGASWADFVESDARARRVLEENLASLELESRSRVWRLRLPHGLEAMQAELSHADLVLADPPYGGRDANAVLATLGMAGRLSATARVVIEHHGKDSLPETVGVLRCARQRRYGETVVSLYRVSAGAESGDQEER
jgi:16S rRNA (guanine966-N2)-methyltransferase